MRSTTLGLSLALITGASALTLAPSTAAAPAANSRTSGEAQSANSDHVLPNPEAEKQAALRNQAWADVLSGEATPETINGNTVLKVGKKPVGSGAANARAKAKKEDQYVELGNERTDKVFVFLVDFGTQRDPLYPDQDQAPAIPGPVTFEGPGFDEIPQPGPDDNSTQWSPEYTKEYYENLYFGDGELTDSLKSYYERQSSGRYSVEGMVTDVTTVPYNQARYGRSNGYPCARQRLQQHVEPGLGRHDPVGRRPEGGRQDRRRRSRRTVSQYDIRDRYDFDGDGNFDEPDGYIDRFQIIHAGGDQADGDPIYGEDAIWSHRWKAFQNTGQGPTVAGVPNADGGTQIGNTGIWVARLHRAARERRHLRRGPRVRPRPRPARPLRHRGLG